MAVCNNDRLAQLIGQAMRGVCARITDRDKAIAEAILQEHEVVEIPGRVASVYTNEDGTRLTVAQCRELAGELLHQARHPINAERTPDAQAHNKRSTRVTAND